MLNETVKSDKEIKVKLLITGDNNYNNVKKFNKFMKKVYNSIEDHKVVGTFGVPYGAELLGKLYAEETETDYVEFDNRFFKKTTKTPAQLYHVLLNIGVKWSSIIIIFSNIYTPKVKEIINLCEKYKKEYLLVKE